MLYIFSVIALLYEGFKAAFMRDISNEACSAFISLVFCIPLFLLFETTTQNEKSITLGMVTVFALVSVFLLCDALVSNIYRYFKNRCTSHD